jgi:hypothetical protein
LHNCVSCPSASPSNKNSVRRSSAPRGSADGDASSFGPPSCRNTRCAQPAWPDRHHQSQRWVFDAASALPPS